MESLKLSQGYEHQKVICVEHTAHQAHEAPLFMTDMVMSPGPPSLHQVHRFKYSQGQRDHVHEPWESVTGVHRTLTTCKEPNILHVVNSNDKNQSPVLATHVISEAGLDRLGVSCTAVLLWNPSELLQK